MRDIEGFDVVISYEDRVYEAIVDGIIPFFLFFEKNCEFFFRIFEQRTTNLQKCKSCKFTNKG